VTCTSVSVSVCLSVREHISGTAPPIFPRLFMPVAHGRGWVILRRRCDRLCTSGFMDDIMFVHDGPQEWATSLRTRMHKLAFVSNEMQSLLIMYSTV